VCVSAATTTRPCPVWVLWLTLPGAGPCVTCSRAVWPLCLCLVATWRWVRVAGVWVCGCVGWGVAGGGGEGGGSRTALLFNHATIQPLARARLCAIVRRLTRATVGQRPLLVAACFRLTHQSHVHYLIIVGPSTHPPPPHTPTSTTVHSPVQIARLGGCVRRLDGQAWALNEERSGGGGGAGSAARKPVVVVAPKPNDVRVRVGCSREGCAALSGWSILWSLRAECMNALCFFRQPPPPTHTHRHHHCGTA
jgi:hypothetical protein